MGRKIVDYDPHSGITETFHKDEMTGKISVHKQQDITSVLDLNQAQKNNSGTGWKEEFHKVASIPLVVIEMWREELKAKGASNPNPLAAENRIFFIAKLNSRDFSKFRTKEGNI